MIQTKNNNSIDHSSINTGRYVASDVGEIVNAELQQEIAPIHRSSLMPWEQAASLPSPKELPDFSVEVVSRFLGPLLTVASPVWSSHAMLRLRSLQKTLIEHSLTLPQNDRQDCLGAVTMVEQAVVLRLRLEQMGMSDEPADNASVTESSTKGAK